jgi:hypothetical protein
MSVQQTSAICYDPSLQYNPSKRHNIDSLENRFSMSRRRGETIVSNTGFNAYFYIYIYIQRSNDGQKDE